MSKQTSRFRPVNIKTLFLLILTSFILLLLSSGYFIFIRDQINGTSFQKTGWIWPVNLTTLTQKDLWKTNNIQVNKKLFAKDIIEENFTANYNNLGIIWIPFDTHDKNINEKIIFRIKVANEDDWLYQNVYNASQFRNNVPFPFGFPVIVDSKNKSYIFQLEAINKKSKKSVSLSRLKPYFFSKYKFSKAELLKSPQNFAQFIFLKIKSQLPNFSFVDISFVLLISLLPFIIHNYKYIKRKWIELKRTYFPGSNQKKDIFYTTSITGILLFFLSGLITRGYSFYNLFNPDRKDYSMDFYNSLYTLFTGAYTYNSIYPPFPLLLYKVMLRFVPYDIVEKGVIAIRASQAGQIVFLLYVLTTLFLLISLVMGIKKGLRIEKYIFTFVTLFSAPFLFQFERANIIFIALLFLMIFVFFKDSRSRVAQEFALISLAISAAIKIYPVLFGILLLKEKRFKDAIKVSLYGLILFIFPFFAVGGINQLQLFIKNIFSTSSHVASYGLGYSVNIQNIVRILFGFFGDFGKNPIFVGNFISCTILILGIFSTFYLQSKWKTVALITLLMILTPPISYVYALIFMIVPLIMFLDQDKKEKWDNLYLTCFILIFAPFTLGKIDMINIGFGLNPHLPLTYGVLIQNIAISIMVACLICQGIASSRNILRSGSKSMLTFISTKLSVEKRRSGRRRT